MIKTKMIVIAIYNVLIINVIILFKRWFKESDGGWSWIDCWKVVGMRWKMVLLELDHIHNMLHWP